MINLIQQCMRHSVRTLLTTLGLIGWLTVTPALAQSESTPATDLPVFLRVDGAQAYAEAEKILDQMLVEARARNRESQLYYARYLLTQAEPRPWGHSKVRALYMLKDCIDSGNPACASLSWQFGENYLQNLISLGEVQAMRSRAAEVLAESTDNPLVLYRLSQERPDERIDWLRKATRAGHPVAAAEFADLVINRAVPIQIEGYSLLRILTQAAEGGSRDAMFTLGGLLLKGTLLPQNKDLGLRWTQRANATTEDRIPTAFRTDVGPLDP